MNVLACIIRKQYAATHHVAPDCEISALAPIAGRHMNTALVPWQVKSIVFQV